MTGPGVGRAMRALVTGAMNPHGDAVVRALAKAGHPVRAFGVPHDENPFEGLDVQVHPGRIDVTGSIEPVLSQRELLVHAANLDAPGADAKAHAFKIERGTLSARYGVEREQVSAFIALFPAKPSRAFSEVLAGARAQVDGTRGFLHKKCLDVTTPEDAAAQVLAALKDMPDLGMIEGANDAVTA